MSVKDDKEKCGYTDKVVPNTCGNCAAFKSDFVYPKWVRTQKDRDNFDRDDYSKIEKNMRCVSFGFAVKKMGACRYWTANGS